MNNTSVAGGGLSVKKFDGKDYAMWRFQVQMYLEAADLWDVVVAPNASIKGNWELQKKQRPKENVDDLLDEARFKVSKLQRKAMAVISLSLTTEECKRVVKAKSPDEMLSLLDSFNQDKSLTNKLLLKEKFFTTRMEEGDDLSLLIKNMDQLLCELEAIGAAVGDEDAALFLLISLPALYGALKTALKVSNKTLTLKLVKTALRSEEAERNRGKSSGGSGNAGDSALISTNQRPRRNPASTTTTTPSTTPAQTPPTGGGPCWRCDGPHRRSVCPIWKKEMHDNRNHAAQKEKQNRDTNALLVIDSVATVAVATQDFTNWYVDSGVSLHMCSARTSILGLESPEDGDHRVKTASGDLVKVCGTGEVPLLFNRGGTSVNKVLKEVLFVPDLGMNLFSVSAAQKRGADVHFPSFKNYCSLSVSGREFGRATDNGNGIYRLHCTTPKMDSGVFASAVVQEPEGSRGRLPKLASQVQPSDIVGSNSSTMEPVVAAPVVVTEVGELLSPLVTVSPQDKTPTPSLQLWHERLGHIGPKRLKELVRSGALPGVDAKAPLKLANCVACAKGKLSHKAVGSEPATRAGELGELMHTDLCGPMSSQSIGGKLFANGYTDDKSRFTHVYFLKKKNEVEQIFLTLRKFLKRRYGRMVKRLRADRGGEYSRAEFQLKLLSLGITMEFTASHTPEQDGVSERKFRTIIEAARCVLQHAGLPVRF